MGHKLSKQKLKEETRSLKKKSPKAKKASEKVSSERNNENGINVSDSRMHDVIGFKQTIINNIQPKSKERKLTPTIPKRLQWDKLIKRHRKEESWIYPFPWDASIRLAPEDYFIQLSMTVMDRTGTIDLGYVSELEQLFDPVLEGADRPEHILIRGDAGYGKSTLCTKVAFDWANNITTFPAFPANDSLVVLYRLRDLPPESELNEELRTFVHEYYSADQSSSANVQKACWSYGNKLLLILDGYDEISAEHQKQVRDFLSGQHQMAHSYFKQASVIVTSRPDTDQELLYMFDKHCRLTGLSEERRLILVNTFIRRNAGCENSVLTALNFYEDPCTKNLSPLIILMICFICKQGNFDTTVSASQLSLYCIRHMARRCNERENLNLTEDDINRKLYVIGKFFYRCLSDSMLFMRASDMKASLKEHYDFAIQFGILRNTFQSDDNKKKEIFEPIHKHFMDSLAKHFLQEKWLALSNQGRLSFINDFVDGLSTEIFVIQGKGLEYKIKITSKDRRYKGNGIAYTWEINPTTGEAVLLFDRVLPGLMDLSIKVTACNPLEDDTEFFVNYIVNVFSGVSTLKKCVDFLTCFRQHIYRIKFCRSFDRTGSPCAYREKYISDHLEAGSKKPIEEELVSFVPWSKLSEKIQLIEVELGEALLRTSTVIFVCRFLLGLNFEMIPVGGQAKDFFSLLYQNVRNCHDRFFIKCVLKDPVGSQTLTRKKKKHDLVTFQCNLKLKHPHPREIEVDDLHSHVPTFDWNNIQSVILYFSN